MAMKLHELDDRIYLDANIVIYALEGFEAYEHFFSTS